MPERRGTDLRQFYRQMCAKMKVKVNLDLLEK